jgi:hypothetical protein
MITSSNGWSTAAQRGDYRDALLLYAVGIPSGESRVRVLGTVA